MENSAPISHIAEVISQAIAPAFILGAVSGFTSVLVTRLNRIIDRCRIIDAGDRDTGAAEMRALNTRARLINLALFWAVASALVTIFLMVVAFAEAFFDLPHEKIVAALFVAALILFGASLVNFGREICIAIGDRNNFD